MQRKLISHVPCKERKETGESYMCFDDLIRIVLIEEMPITESLTFEDGKFIYLSSKHCILHRNLPQRSLPQTMPQSWQ